jgi:dTDP-glucose 4,6-dehydratase
MESKIKNKTILITGGAGFIGTALSKKLIKDNFIIVYDNLRRNALKYTDLPSKRNFKLIKGNILDFNFLIKILSKFKPDIILHMAAIAGVDTVIKNPTTTLKVNIVGTYNLLDVLYKLKLIKKIERLIYFSSSEVFGINAFKVDEKKALTLQPVGEARWTYAVSKLAGEHLVHAYYKEYGLRIVTLRPFNVYGPGQIGEGAIHCFIERAIKNQPLEIHGEGDQIRSWCYIDDMIQGILLALEKEKAIGEVFNIGNPKGTITILSLAEKIVQLANSKSPIIHVPKPYIDVELRIPDIEKAKKILGFNPKVDLNEGLKRTIKWYREKHEN